MTSKAVLVTRPAAQSAGILEAIEQIGVRPVPFPLLKLEKLLLDQAAKQIVLNLDSYDLVIFVSGPAVQFGMDWIETYWPQLPVAITWFAVGESTADRLRQFNVDVLTPARENSEGLLELEGLQHVESKKVLIIRGAEGREKLAETLQARGAQVQYLDTYRRERTRWTSKDLYQLLDRFSVDIIMITSGAGLEHLAQLLRAKTRLRVELILPSQRLVDLADNLGFPHCHLAAGADDNSMLDALSRIIEA
jgi:uroporphyrinogen-III synthase